MPLDVGRVSHLVEQMHRSEDDAGDPIPAGKLLAADGARGLQWVDSATGLGWFNVMDYGATGDGSTDDTAAIQATIDAAAAAEGGVIYFPVGEYIIGGALQDTGARNAQLLLPTEDTSVPLPVFKFLGANRVTQHNIGTRPDPGSFSVLRSTLTGGTGTAAVISGGNEIWTDRNSISVAIQDLICIAPNNPSLTWWNLYSTQGASVYDVVIHVLAMPDVSTEPTNTNAYGIRLPHRGNSNYTRVDGLLVGGHYTGVEVSELVIARGIAVGMCIVGVELTSAPHAFLLTNYQQAGCTYGVRVTSGSFDVAGRILYQGTEHLADPPFEAWNETVYDFDDPDDAFVGDVTWWSADYTGPVDHIYNVNGGANGVFTELGDTPGGGSLDDLTDVTITTPAADDTLSYNGSIWVNSARRWEAVTDGEDVFVWEGDDLVHEFKEY